MSLKGKVIAITGAASGIGLSLSHLLASEGATLSLADLSPDPLDALAISLAKKGTKLLSTQLDVRSPTDVDAWIASTIKAFGRLDGAANLAGIFRQSGSLLDSTNEEFEGMFAVNFYGVVNCMRVELKAMRENGGSGKEGKVGGSVVNASSMAGLQGRAMYASYIASKHAVMGVTRVAAKEVGQLGIRVNAICPGVVRTPMIENHESEHGFTFPTEQIPLQRAATPEDVAKAIRWLLSEESGYINGVGLPIEGGSNASSA